MHNKEITGKLFDIKGFSVHDGPGIRITLFLKGCHLRCPWCHSPESQAFNTELNWIEKKCAGIEKCGRCIGSCPRGAISPGKTRTNEPGGASLMRLDGQMLPDTGFHSSNSELKSNGANGDNDETGVRGVQIAAIDRSNCDNCGACANACSTGALFMCGIDYTVDEIMGRIRREAPFFNRSGGGVTISGGECLGQPEFTLEILKRCKEESIHTAVDTSGFAKWEAIEPILPYTDIFLYDIKGIDSALHKQVIGAPNERILENARKIAAAGGELHIRIPFIPGYSDSAESINDIAKFIIGLGAAVKAVQILPYHKLGAAKWERLQKDMPIFEAVPPSDELIYARRKQLEDMGLNVTDN